MITKDQYLAAFTTIAACQKTIDEYRNQNNLSMGTQYTDLTIEGIEVALCTMLDGKPYLSFQVKGEEVQRIEDFTIGINKDYLMQGGRYGQDAKTVMKHLAAWFKRRGMKVKPKAFSAAFISHLDKI